MPGDKSAAVSDAMKKRKDSGGSTAKYNAGVSKYNTDSRNNMKYQDAAVRQKKTDAETPDVYKQKYYNSKTPKKSF